MRGVINDVEEKLRSHDYKMTPNREHVLRVLLENKDKHLSAEDVYNLVKQRVPDVGLATVYRTLDLYHGFNIIHRTDFGDGRKRYEFGGHDFSAHKHHHLICQSCNKIVEMDENLLEGLEDLVTRTYDFQIKDHELKIFGLCRDCSGKKEK